MKHTIFYNGNSLTADSLGAELNSVKIRGKERLYQGDGVWHGHAPVLFPVCGKCSMIVGGKDYGIPFHGFARQAEFTLEEKTDDSLTFSLESNESTLKVYPFGFKFFVVYKLTGGGVKVAFRVENTGDKPITFSLGGHESYLLDKNVGDFKIEFNEEQNLSRYAFNGVLSARPTKKYVDMKEFSLPEKYLATGKTVIFSGVTTKNVLLKRLDGTPMAKIDVAGFDNLLLWQPTGEKCICVEPWLTLPDSAKTIAVEFKDKKGAITLNKGESKTFIRNIEYY